MKARILFILLLSHLFSYGQIQEMLVDTNKLWSNLFQAASGGPPPYLKTTDYVKFSGDTIIGTNQFKKVWQSYDALQSNYSLTGYIREDSTHKVYYRQLTDTAAMLIYDFNAAVGDTIYVWGYNYVEMVVDTIDSVFIYDGYRKRFVFNTGEQWVEGIGSLCGVMESGAFLIVGGKFDLLCYFENNILKYKNPDFTGCYYNTTGIEDHEQNSMSVNIFPNPVTASSVLNIDSEQDKYYLLEIYSIMGGKIRSMPIKNRQVLIHRSDFNSGMYFYRVISSGSKIVSGRFIVE